MSAAVRVFVLQTFMANCPTPRRGQPPHRPQHDVLDNYSRSPSERIRYKYRISWLSTVNQQVGGTSSASGVIYRPH